MRDLFAEHGLAALHEWPEAQDQVIALLEARRKGHEKRVDEAGGVNVPPESRESHRARDS